MALRNYIQVIKKFFGAPPRAPERIPGYEDVVNEDQQLAETVLSERILMALSRMKQAESSPHEGVDMSVYFRSADEVCYACLGGWGLVGRMSLSTAWMQGRDTRDIATYRDPSFWTLGCYQVSLDRAKDGNIYEAFVMMDLDPIQGRRYDCHITHYEEDSRAFYRDMHELADRLQRDGY